MKRWLALFLIATPIPGSADTLIATRTLPAGTILTHEDVTAVPDDSSPSVMPEDVVGLQTRVMIYEGKPVRPGRLTAPVLVSRNQLVTLVYETPMIVIETEGRALDAGQAGEVIRAMNLSSRTTVSGRVSPDGTILIQQK